MATRGPTTGVPATHLPEIIRRTADTAISSTPRLQMVRYLAWLERETREVRLALGWAEEVDVGGRPALFTPADAAVNAFFANAPAPMKRAAAVLAAAGLEVH